MLSYLLLMLVGVSSIAVSWHRHLLLDESSDSLIILRLNWQVFRYSINLLLFFLVLSAVQYLLAFGLIYGVLMPLFAVGVMYGVLSLFILPVLFWILGGVLFVYGARLAVRLPALAIGKGYSYGEAWRDSRGNTVRLFGFVALFLVIVWGGGYVGPLIPFVVLGGPGPYGQAAYYGAVIGQLFLGWLVMMLTFTALTELFAVFSSPARK